MANNSPPESNAANDHTARPGPNRNTHDRAATPIASNASANPSPAGKIGPNSASNTNAQRVKCARIASAFAANRASHRRTVLTGTPNSAAIRRYPRRRARASIAAPITAAAY